MAVRDIILAAAGVGGRGEAIFTSSGSFVVPDGVTSVSAVCIGGGGGGALTIAGGSGGRGGDLRYYNNLSVTPGETLTITVGAKGISGSGTGGATAGGPSSIARGGTVLLLAGGGDHGSNDGSGNATNGTSSTIGGSVGGGDGGISDNPTTTTCGGGGGAGGYSGKGGDGPDGNVNGDPGVGGAGGGGGGGSDADHAGNGGGVNVFGEGPNGEGGKGNINDGDNATGGSFGDGSLNYNQSGTPGNTILANFGAGAAGADNTSDVSIAGQGAVRIVWPGESRSFPSTDVWMSKLVTTVIETQSNSNSITIPASAQVGDLAVLVNMNESTGTQADPSGWTRIVNQQASNPVMTVWYRLIESGDAGASVTVTNGTATSVEMILFRGSPAFSSATVFGETIARTTGLVADQTQNISTASGTFIAFGVFANINVELGSSDLYFTGGIAGGSDIEPSAVFTGGNGDTTRQTFIRFRIYDEAPSSDLVVKQTRSTGATTIASFFIEVN